MSYARLNFNTGNVIDPTRGATKALSNAGTILAQADQIRARKVEEARQAKADARADVLFGQQQDEYNRKINDRNALNIVGSTWTPQNGNADGLEPLTQDIAKKFDVGNAKAEAIIKARGLDANNRNDQEEIGRIYDHAIYGKLDPYSTNQNTQAIFDNNAISKEYARRQIMQDVVNAGGSDVAQALALANSMTGDLQTRKQLEAEAISQANAQNKANKENYDRQIEAAKLFVNAQAKDNNRYKVSSSKSSSDNPSVMVSKSGSKLLKPYSKINTYDALNKFIDEKNYGSFDTADVKRSTEKAKELGFSPEVQSAFLDYRSKQNGAFPEYFFGSNDSNVPEDEGNKYIKELQKFAKEKGLYSNSGTSNGKVVKVGHEIVIPKIQMPKSVAAKTLEEIDADKLANARKQFNKIWDVPIKNKNNVVVKKPSSVPKKEVLNPIANALNKSGTNPDVFNLFAKDPVAFGKEYAKLGSSDKKRVDKLLATDRYKKLLEERNSTETAAQFKAPTLDELDALANARQEKLSDKSTRTNGDAVRDFFNRGFIHDAPIISTEKTDASRSVTKNANDIISKVSVYTRSPELFKRNGTPGSSNYGIPSLISMLKQSYSDNEIKAMQSNPNIPYNIRKLISKEYINK